MFFFFGLYIVVNIASEHFSHVVPIVVNEMATFSHVFLIVENSTGTFSLVVPVFVNDMATFFHVVSIANIFPCC